MDIIALNNTTDTIIGSLSGAVSTDQPEFIFIYADATSNSFEEGRSIGEFNGVTEVTLVSAPASGEVRIVRAFSITNKDDAQVTITLSYDDDTTPREIATVTLNSGDTWTNKGVFDSDGKLKQAFSASSTEIATEIDNATEKTTLADDDKFSLLDSASSFVLKWIDWASIKGTLNAFKEFKGQSADPSDPADGDAVMWVSDGSGSGDVGDLMVKINVGGTVKTITLIDYSTS